VAKTTTALVLAVCRCLFAVALQGLTLCFVAVRPWRTAAAALRTTTVAKITRQALQMICHHWSAL